MASVNLRNPPGFMGVTAMMWFCAYPGWFSRRVTASTCARSGSRSSGTSAASLASSVFKNAKAAHPKRAPADTTPHAKATRILPGNPSHPRAPKATKIATARTSHAAPKSSRIRRPADVFAASLSWPHRVQGPGSVQSAKARRRRLGRIRKSANDAPRASREVRASASGVRPSDLSAATSAVRLASCRIRRRT